jgi:hypothetical protein
MDEQVKDCSEVESLSLMHISREVTHFRCIHDSKSRLDRQATEKDP